MSGKKRSLTQSADTDLFGVSPNQTVAFVAVVGERVLLTVPRLAEFIQIKYCPLVFTEEKKKSYKPPTPTNLQMEPL